MSAVIALDVGGSSVKSGLVLPNGIILGAHGDAPGITTTPIDSTTDAESILGTLAMVIQGHLRKDCAGIAFGFPGPFDYDNGVSLIHGVEKYEAIYGMNIGAELRKRLALDDMPVRFRNDAEAAIVGECLFGAGKPYPRVIGVTLGTGFGSGFMIDGKRQTSGVGVPPDGWLYPEMFNDVRADDYFSIRGLEQKLREAEIHAESIEQAAKRARAGDAAAQAVFITFGQELGQFLLPYMHDFSADAVLVLGGISGAFDLFGAACQNRLPAAVIKGQRQRESALLGAAQLIFDSSF